MARRKQPDPASTTVRFPSGSSICVTFNGNLFDLSEEERQLVSNLTSVVQNYQERARIRDGTQEVAK